MPGYRKNSFVIDFSVMPVRPKLNVVQDFIFAKMSLDMSVVKNLQTSITKSQVIIEVDSAATAENIIIQNSLKHSVEYEQQLYPIPVHSADNAVEVRVYDLPPQMPNQLIASHFSAYGKVLSVKDDVWKEYFPGVPNGVRIVRMEIQKPIPSYVPVAGELAYVLHINQVKTCKHCAQKVHIGKSCSAARKETSSQINAGRTLAEIVSNTREPEKDNEIIVDLMDVVDSSDESDVVDPLSHAAVPNGKESAKTNPMPVPVPAESSMDDETKSTTALNELETDPLGGRKRPLSPKLPESETQRVLRKPKSQRQLSK